MTDQRTLHNRGGGCAHVYTRPIGPYLKCAACGTVMSTPTYLAECPDCEWELHGCGYCGQTLDHTMSHVCPKAHGA